MAYSGSAGQQRGDWETRKSWPSPGEPQQAVAIHTNPKRKRGSTIPGVSPSLASDSPSLALRVSVAVAVLCAVLAPASAQEVATEAKPVFDFEEPEVAFHADFPGARLNDCTRVAEAEYEVRILPENTPINNSAWYAFQVTSASPRTITVRLTYEGGTHRYQPKISRDGAGWTPLGPQAYTRQKTKGEATLRLDVGPEPLWVAAQELVTSKELNAWTDKIANLEFVRKGVLGRSVLGRPIYKLQTTGAEPSRCVFIIGRQHPPEVTGSFGLMEFVETLLGDTELAKRFRARFQLVVVPLVNPDGVDAGHWRHNMNGVDLNRDWDTFAQPETRALRDELDRFKPDRGPRLYLFLDFHSTHGDVFYTQPDDEKTFPEGFTRTWLDAIQARFPDYRMRQVGSHGTTLNTSKRWVYEVFGCPSITYELGDHTDRALIRRTSRGAAEAMMRLLVAEVDSAKDRAAWRDHLNEPSFPRRSVGTMSSPDAIRRHGPRAYARPA